MIDLIIRFAVKMGLVAFPAAPVLVLLDFLSAPRGGLFAAVKTDGKSTHFTSSYTSRVQGFSAGKRPAEANVPHGALDWRLPQPSSAHKKNER